MISIERANEMIWERFQHIKINTVDVDILEGLGKILAKDVVSAVDVPEFNRSMCDGYAVISSDTHDIQENNPGVLKYRGEILMGKDTDIKISKEECAYVSTGGIIPTAADAVVMVEKTRKSNDDTVSIYQQVSSGEHLILKGDDIQKGQLLFRKGERLSPRHIGALAAAGIYQVKVYCGPGFTIISTGDELLAGGEKMEIGKIRDSNSYVLNALVRKSGGEVVRQVMVRDDREMYKEELDNALATSDIVLISGGCSVGIRDFTAQVINSLPGEGVFIHGMDISPGRPVVVGEVYGKPVFGLPGHPFAPIIIYKVLVEKLLKRLAGNSREINTTTAIIDFDMHPAMFTHLIVELEERSGELYAQSNNPRNPAQSSAIARANGYIRIDDRTSGLSKGERREVVLF